MSEGAGVQPAVRRPTYRARIERILDHNPDTRSLFLRVVDAALPRFVPGQFISVALPLESGPRVRPYSIASSPEDGEPFEICFNAIPGADGVAYLFGLGPGDAIEFTGPFGLFTLDRAPGTEVVFIAEGTGIAPIRPMIRRARASNPHPPLHLLYAASRPEGILYRAELESWAGDDNRFGFDTIVVPGAGPTGSSDELYRRLIEETEARWVTADSDRSRQFYVCGVGRGVLQIRDLLRGAGYERRAVRYEQW